MSDFDRMFKDFEDRKRREQEAKEQERSKEKRLREETMKALREMVLPTLQELSTDIERRGHESTITELLEKHSYPSVQLHFKPKIKDIEPLAMLSVSTINFIHTDSGQIEVKQNIMAKTEKVPGYDRSEGTPPSKVNKEWVRSKVLIFLDAVLKAN